MLMIDPNWLIYTISPSREHKELIDWLSIDNLLEQFLLSQGLDEVKLLYMVKQRIALVHSLPYKFVRMKIARWHEHNEQHL